MVGCTGDRCIDTIGWRDRINNSTCSNYVSRGWCKNKTFILPLRNYSIPLLNFPELNCCECGKRGEYKQNLIILRIKDQ